jgi:hypothetical protein
MLFSIPLASNKFLIDCKMNFKLTHFENPKPIEKQCVVFFNENFCATRSRWRFFIGFKNMTEWKLFTSPYLQLELDEGSYWKHLTPKVLSFFPSSTSILASTSTLTWTFKLVLLLSLSWSPNCVTSSCTYSTRHWIGHFVHNLKLKKKKERKKNHFEIWKFKFEI